MIKHDQFWLINLYLINTENKYKNILQYIACKINKSITYIILLNFLQLFRNAVVQ